MARAAECSFLSPTVSGWQEEGLTSPKGFSSFAHSAFPMTTLSQMRTRIERCR